MDFWNRKKVKMLEGQILSRDNQIVDLMKDIDKLKNETKGEHCITRACSKCKHGIKIDKKYDEIANFCGNYWSNYVCELEIKCKDYERNENA